MSSLPGPGSAWARRAIGSGTCKTCLKRCLIAPNPTQECKHPAEVCWECTRRRIESVILRNGGIGSIKCPIDGCKSIIFHQEIRTRTRKNIFDRYDTSLLMRFLKNNSNYAQCANEDCGSRGFFILGENDQFLICYGCGTKRCLRHRVQWRSGAPCERCSEDAESDCLNYQWILHNTKPCPVCRHPFEKNGGCSTVDCRFCGTRFCWRCLAVAKNRKWSETKHYENCLFLRSEVGKPAPPLPLPAFLEKALNIRTPGPREVCIICLDTPTYFPRLPPTDSCSHKADICHVCLKRMIESRVDAGYAANGIFCPNDTCRIILSHGEVRKWADSAVFERYDRVVLLRALNNDTNFFWCLNSSCGAGMFRNMNDDNPRITCYVCGEGHCFLHQCKWHKGLTCGQYQKKCDAELEGLSLSWINEQTKPCPNPGCARRIEKDGGCNHMICQRPAGCGFEFCWLCLAPQDLIRQQGNSAHYDNCSYYTGTSGGNPAPHQIVLQMEPLQELVGPILDYPLEKPSESSVPGSSNVNSNINSDIPTIDTAIGYNLISNEAPKDKNTPVKVASHLILSKPVPDRKRASGDRVPSIFSQNPVSEEAFGEPWFHHLQPKPLQSHPILALNGITLQGQQPVSIAGHLLYDPLLDLRHPPLLPTEVNPDFRKDDRTSQGGRVLRGKYQHLRRQIKAPLEPRDSTIGPGGTGNALQAKSNITLDSFRAWGQRSHPNPTSSSSRYLPLSLILDALEDPPIRGYDNPDTTSASDQLISVSKPKRTLESIRSNEEDSPPPSLFLTKLKRLKSMQKRRKRTRRRRDGRT